MRRSPALVTLAAGLLLNLGLVAVPAKAAQAPPVRDLIFAGLQGGYVYSSTNGGSSWREADTGLPQGSDVTTLALSSHILYAGTDGSGVFSSSDSGTTWQDANGGSVELAGAQVRGLVVDPRYDRIAYVATANGSFFRTGDEGRHWISTSLPVSSPITVLTIAERRTDSLLFAGTASDGILVSHDGGVTWSVPDGSVPAGVAVNGLASDPLNGNVAYAATTDGVYQTIDGGVSWQPERRGIAPGTILQAVAIDPHAGTRIAAGGSDGSVFLSTDGGTGWKEYPGTGGSQINTLIFDPVRAGTVLAGTTDGSAQLVGGSEPGAWYAPPITTTRFAGQGGVLCLAALARPALPTDAVQPPYGNPAGVRYFPQSHHMVRGPFLRFYDRYGGLKIFGLPLTEAFGESGQSVQYFERARFALAGPTVQITPLGLWLTAGRQFHTTAPFPATATAIYFAETHHSLRGSFLAFWRNHHGNLLFGPPTSEPLREQNGDGTGRTYLVQYFRNARMEYHPELSGTRYEVTLGQLGRQYLQRRGWL